MFVVKAVVKKNFDSPDEQIKPGRGKVDIVQADGVTLRRITFNPGWRWTEDVKPEANTDLCQVPHVFAHISGKLGVKMADGKQYEFGPSDISVIPPGHDAWVVGKDPVTIIDQTSLNEN